MKIRYGLILTLAASVGVMGCAAAASSGPGAGAHPVPAGTKIAAGEPVRQTADTRAAEDALKKASRDTAEAQSHPLFQQALTSANAAVKADTLNPLAYLQRGEALMGLGQYAQADSALKMAQKLRPLYQFEIEPMREHAWVKLFNEAAPIVNQGDYKKAAGLLQQANDIYKGRPEAMIILGQIYAQQHKDTLALENLNMAQKVIAERGSQVDSTTLKQWKAQAKNIPFTKAQVLAGAGRFEEAIAQYRKISAANPTDLMTKRNLATIELQAGHKDSAIAILDSLMTESTTADDFYQLGIRYFEANSFSKAATAFQKAATMSPKNRDALELWTRSLRQDSAYAQIPPVARRWIALDPNNANAYIILAQALNKEHKNTAEVNSLVDKVQALKVKMSELSLHAMPEGGGYVAGTLVNVSLSSGTQVTLHFTFYDDSGASLGTTTETVQVGEKGGSTSFRSQFNSSKQIGGYGYTLSTS